MSVGRCGYELVLEKRNPRECGIRRSLSTTNTAEAVNGQLEKIRLDSGGYFQSEAILKLKLGAAVSTLEQTGWAHPSASICEALHQLNVMFQARFEAVDGHNILYKRPRRSSVPTRVISLRS